MARAGRRLASRALVEIAHRRDELPWYFGDRCNCIARLVERTAAETSGVGLDEDLYLVQLNDADGQNLNVLLQATAFQALITSDGMASAGNALALVADRCKGLGRRGRNVKDRSWAESMSPSSNTYMLGLRLLIFC